jgi:hypothetical protein
MCFNRGNVSTSAEHAANIRCDSDLVLVGNWYQSYTGNIVIGGFLLFARKDCEYATTLLKMGWKSDGKPHEWRGKLFTRFEDLPRSKNAIRAELENVFPGIVFEGWERIL